MSTSPQLCRQFSLDEIKVATRNFDDELILGKGGFGLVYRGSINDGTETVAIKRLSCESTQGETEFLREIQTLSKLQHNNLVCLKGYCNESPEKILVYEYMPNGTLVDHLYKTTDSGCTTATGDNESPRLSWEQRLNICIGAAQGLDFLHRGVPTGIIHRDIKGSNILLDDNFVAKIADFGLAKLVRATSDPQITYVSTTLVRGTFGYMDPEYFNTQRLTLKSDVYAFGVVMLVVLSGRPAVDNKAEEDKRSLSEWAKKCIKKSRVDLIVDPYLDGQISPQCLKKFVEVSKKCLNRRSEERPTMEEVVAGLQKALRKQLSGTSSKQPNEMLSFTQMIRAKLQTSKKNQQSGSKADGRQRLEAITVVSHPIGYTEYIKSSGFSDQLPPKAPISSVAVHNTILGRPYEDIKGSYHLGKELGRGQFWVTYLCTKIENGEQYACKSISKKKLVTDGDKDGMRREINIMQHLSGHTNIVEFEGAFEDKNNVHIVMELCAGGTLFDRIVAVGHLSEQAAASLCRSIVNVLHYCHSLGVMHGDLKPENFLFSDKSQNATLKLTGFGLSMFIREGEIFHDVAGNDYYREGERFHDVVGNDYCVAPEVLRRQYSKEVDIWSAGVILYILLSGVPPFYAEDKTGLFDAILRGHIDFESEPWPYISSSAKDLLGKMLIQDPKERITATQVLHHPWAMV